MTFMGIGRPINPIDTWDKSLKSSNKTTNLFYSVLGADMSDPIKERAHILEEQSLPLKRPKFHQLRAEL